MFKEVLPKYSFKLMQDIFSLEDFSGFYLAGGTSLALQIGHRESIDLDFFTNTNFTIDLINSFPRTNNKFINLHNNSIELISDKTKVMFFRFAFPLSNELINLENLKLANPIDIGLMKLLAIHGRSTKKDIIDLYFIDKEIIDLHKLIDLFNEVYSKENLDVYSAVKTIFNSTSIDLEPTPKMRSQIDWQEIKVYVLTKIVDYFKNQFE